MGEQRVGEYYFHIKYGVAPIGSCCKLYFICSICNVVKRYDLFTDGSPSKLHKLRKKGGKAFKICCECRSIKAKILEKERILMNISLKKLCEQPDILNSPVIALSASRDDKIKVSIGRSCNGEYSETRIRVMDNYEQAVSCAKEWANIVGTNHMYEIRVFKDGTSECMKILK